MNSCYRYLRCMPLVFVASLALLAGCAGSPAWDPKAPLASDMARFQSSDYRLVIDYPRDVDASRSFVSDYFLGSRWDSSSDGNTAGTPLLALTLPDSNQLVRAVMRIGASDDARAVDVCLPAPGTTDRRIDGIEFIRVDQGDAAMSHYSQTRSYRAVRDEDQCIAIDLIVTGTRAGVYDVQDRPEQPFTPDQAMSRLTDLLDGIHFLR